jgi:peroxiredoxin
MSLTAASDLYAQAPASGKEPTSSKERLDAIVRSQNEARERYSSSLKGKPSADVQQAALERYRAEIRDNTRAALDLVRAHPKDRANVEALAFVIRTAKAGPGDESDQALEILLRDHVRDPGIGDVGGTIFYFAHSPVAESFLRAVAAKNPSRSDRGRACHMLALYLKYKANVVRRVREEPSQLERFVPDRRKAESALMVKQADPDALEREAESLLGRVIAEFGDVEDGFDHRPIGTIAEGELFQMRSLGIGKVAPDITGKDAAGQSFALSDYKGKVVVLTFSGNWCGPCVGMYPHERELVVKHRGKPFAILSVSTDEKIDTLKKSIDSGEITWRCWYDGGVTGPITTKWGVRSFPSIFVLDKAGVIRFKDVRGVDLEKAVASLLGDAKVAEHATEPTRRASEGD